MTDESAVIRDDDTDTFRDAAGAITDFPSSGSGIPQGGPLTSDLDADSFKVTNAADPTNAQDYVTKAYGDANYMGGGVPGSIVASGTRSTNQTTTGTNFAGGADILAAALSFTANGTSSYAVEISSPALAHSATNGIVDLYLNLDSADAGYIADQRTATAGHQSPTSARTVIVAPAAGVHTVNVRLVSGNAGTSTLIAGAGGAATARPCLVTVTQL